nr:choice-of-anchor Q domain-containing protein [Lysobacter spongiae]
MKSDDQCRALGNAISVGLVAGQDITIRHNTITGQGDCLILSEGGSSTSSLNIQNNALIGQVDWRSDLQGNTGELTCGHYAYNSSARLTYSGNLFYNVKQGQCPSGSTCSNPRIASTAIGNFDATPQSGSPLIDKAPYLAGLDKDFYGNARPSGSAADIGAIEVQVSSGHPPPSISKPLPPQLKQLGSGGSASTSTAAPATPVAGTTDDADSSVPAADKVSRAWSTLGRFLSLARARAWNAPAANLRDRPLELAWRTFTQQPRWLMAAADFFVDRWKEDGRADTPGEQAAHATQASRVEVAPGTSASAPEPAIEPASNSGERAQPVLPERGEMTRPLAERSTPRTSSRALASSTSTLAR